MLAERGFIGLAGWGTVLGALFLMLGRIRKAAAAGFRPLGVEQLYGLFGALAAHALVIELSHFRHTWIIFALITPTAMQAGPPAPAPRRGRCGRSHGRRRSVTGRVSRRSTRRPRELRPAHRRVPDHARRHAAGAPPGVPLRRDRRAGRAPRAHAADGAGGRG